MKVKRIDHVAVAVKGISDALPVYGLLGMQAAATEELPDRGVRVAFLPAGECQVEMLEPLAPESNVGRFLQKRGEGIHHICLAVEDIDSAIEELLNAGVRMIDAVARPGAGGHRVAFIHPDSTHGVLVELLEDSNG